MGSESNRGIGGLALLCAAALLALPCAVTAAGSGEGTPGDALRAAANKVAEIPAPAAEPGGAPETPVPAQTGRPAAGQVGQTGSPAPSTGVSADAPAAPSTDETIPFDAELDGLLLSPEPYYYQGLGRRDIFVSLVSEQYREDNPPSAPVSSQLHVVGILWAEKDRFALIETDDEKSMILREGDPVGDGTVIEILPNRVVIHVTEYGTSRNVSLPLEQRGDDHARSRNR